MHSDLALVVPICALRLGRLVRASRARGDVRSEGNGHWSGKQTGDSYHFDLSFEEVLTPKVDRKGSHKYAS